MPHYYFHIDGKTSHRDANGEDFDDDQKAWSAAIRLMREFESHLVPGEEWRVEVVRDQTPIYLISVWSRQF